MTTDFQERYWQRMRETLLLPRATSGELATIEERLGQVAAEIPIPQNEHKFTRSEAMRSAARDIARVVLSERSYTKHPIYKERYKTRGVA